jgi:3-oxoadipate enol-lactonase
VYGADFRGDTERHGMPFAQLGSRQLLYTRQGNGQPLLLIQGMAAHHGMWGEPLLSRLADDFDVVAFDYRGIGDSTDVPGQFTTVDLAEDAVAVLDALEWPAAHIVGISLGGMVAQELALRHGERVRTLTLGCTYAGGVGSTLDAPGPIAMFQAMNAGDIEVAIRAAFTANLSPTYTADESHFAPFKTAALAVVVPVPVVLRQAQAAVLHNTSTRLPTLDVPTLVLHGTLDQMLPYRNGQQIAGLVPYARLHTFVDVGHLFWWERTDESAALLREHCLAARSAS